MSKTKVITEIKKTFICLETNKILKESFHKFETDYSFNPLTIVDNKLVPIVNDFIFGLPTEVQKPLIYLENYIGKGVNQFLKGLNFLSDKLKVLNLKTNEQLEKYLKEHKLISKDNLILSFKVIGGLLIIIFLMSAFKSSEKSFENSNEPITYTKVSDNKIIEVLPLVKKEIKTPQERKAKNALKKEKKLLGAVKKENKEVRKLLKSFEETLPKYNLPVSYQNKLVPKGVAKNIFFTDAQFKTLVKLVHTKFSKFEDEFRINAIAETGRFTYEGFTRGEKVINGKLVHGWNMSDLSYVSGNSSGIKCFNKENQAFVIKYDDGVNPIDKAGNSRFILFQRNNLYDFDNWMLYQVSVTLANKKYYNPLNRNYKNLPSYCYEFKDYATKDNYCQTLLSRARMVEKMLKS